MEIKQTKQIYPSGSTSLMYDYYVDKDGVRYIHGLLVSYFMIGYLDFACFFKHGKRIGFALSDNQLFNA